MKLILHIAYESVAGLKQDYESQLKMGGVFAQVGAPPDLEPFALIGVQLELPGQPPIRTQARITVATEESICAEVLPEERAALDLAITAAISDVPEGSSPNRHSVTLADPSRPAAARTGTDAQKSAPLTIDRKIAAMSTSEKVQLALHGDREARMLLVRDRVPTVQMALLRNPKTTLDEVLALARAPHLGAEAAEAIGEHRSFGSSAQVALALVRNPRTPPPIAIALLDKLQQSDLRTIAKGLGVRSQVASAARKKLFGT